MSDKLFDLYPAVEAKKSALNESVRRNQRRLGEISGLSQDQVESFIGGLPDIPEPELTNRDRVNQAREKKLFDAIRERNDRAWATDGELDTPLGQLKQNAASFIEEGSRIPAGIAATPSVAAASNLGGFIDEDIASLYEKDRYYRGESQRIQEARRGVLTDTISGRLGPIERAAKLSMLEKEEQGLSPLSEEEVAQLDSPVDWARAGRAAPAGTNETTYRQLIENQRESLDTATDLFEGIRSPVKGVNNPLDKQAMSADLATKLEEGAPFLANAQAAFEKGDRGTVIKEGAKGLGKLLAGAGEAVWANPAATLQHISGVAPQLLTALNGVGLVADNLGYGLDVVREGMEDFREKNQGRMPSAEQQEQIIAAGLGAALLDTVGDAVLAAPLKRTFAKLKNPQSATDSAKDRLKNAGKTLVGGVVGGAATEAPTEIAQTYLEESVAKIDGEATPEQLYEAGVIGGVAGGGMRAPSSAAEALVNDRGNTTKGRDQVFTNTPKRREALKTAKETGDVAPLLDPQNKGVYQPVIAMALLAKKANDPETSPEEREALETQISQIHTELKDVTKAKKEAQDLPEDEVAEDREAVTALNKQLEARLKEDLTDETRTKIEETLAKNKRGLAVNSYSQKTYDELLYRADGLMKDLRNIKTERDYKVTENLDKAVKEKDTAAATEVAKAVTNNPDTLPVATLTELAEDPDNGFSDDQRMMFRKLAEAKVAENNLKSGKDVRRDITQGSDGYKSVPTYFEEVSSALAKNAVGKARESAAQLNKFRSSHESKAAAYARGLERMESTKKPVYIIPNRTGDTVEWEAYSLLPDGVESTESMGGFTMTPRAAKAARRQTQAIARESEYLNKAQEALDAQIQAAQGVAPATTAPAAETQTEAPAAADLDTPPPAFEPDAPVADYAEYAQSGPAASEPVANEPAPTAPEQTESEASPVPEEVTPAATEETAAAPIADAPSLEGQVNRGPDVDPLVQQFLEFALSRFNQTGRQFVIMANDSLRTGDEALQALAPANVLSGFQGHLSQPNKNPELAKQGKQHNPRGTHYPGERAGVENVTYVALDTAMPIDAQLTTLAHEVGHNVYQQAFANAPKEQRDAVYQAFLDDVANKGDAYKRYSDESKFEEWFADQVQLFLVEDGAKRGPVAEFFRDLINTLKEVFATFQQFKEEQGKLAPGFRAEKNETAQEFIRNIADAGIVPRQPEVKPNTKAEKAAIYSPYSEKVDLEKDRTAQRKTENLVARDTVLKPDVRKGTVHPLSSIKDFFSRWGQNPELVQELLPDGTVITQKQRQALGLFRRYVEGPGGWLQVTRNAVTSLGEKGYRPRNYLLYFRDAEGNLDENIVTAMAYAAFSWATESAGSNGFNDNETINKILGHQTDRPTSPDERAALQWAGMPEDMVIEALGRRALSAAGIQIKETAPEGTREQLVGALGTYSLLMLREAGLVTKEPVTSPILDVNRRVNAELAAWKDELVKQGKWKGGPAQTSKGVPFIRPTRQAVAPEGKTIAPVSAQVQELLDTARDTQDILGTVFASESALSWPSGTPRDFNQAKAKRRNEEVPNWLARRVQKLQQVPWGPQLRMTDLLSVFSDEELLQMDGVYDTDQPYAHPLMAAGRQGYNDSKARELDHLRQFAREMTDARHGDKGKDFYLEYEVWSIQRLGVKKGIFNPQASKLQRFFFGPRAWSVSLHPSKNTKRMTLLKVAVSQGLGIKTDKRPIKEVMGEFKDKVANEVNAPAIEALRKQQRGETLSAEERQAVVTAVRDAEGLHTLQALTSWATVLEARSQKLDSVQVDIAYEVDGVTNGPAFAQLLLRGGKDLRKFAQQFGFFSEESTDTNFPSWIDRPGNRDIYQLLTGTIKDKLYDMYGADMRLPRTIELFTGSLTEFDEKGDMSVTSAGRNLVKTPLTSLMFGAGLDGVIQNMSLNFVETVYEVLENVANNESVDDFRATLTAVNALLVEGDAKPLPTHLTPDKFFPKGMNANQHTALVRAFEGTMGPAIRQGLEDHFGGFLENRKKLNQAINNTMAAYIEVHNKLLEDYRMELLESGELAKNKDGKGPAEGLSRVQYQAFLDQLKLPKAIVATFGALQDDNLDAGLSMTKTKNQKIGRNSPAYLKPSIKLDKAGYTQDSSWELSNEMVPEMTQRVMDLPGVSTLIGTIHATDNAVASEAYKDFPVLHVHDAEFFGLDDIIKGSQAMNKATYQMLGGYSPGQEIIKQLSVMANRLQKYARQYPDLEIPFYDQRIPLKNHMDAVTESINQAGVLVNGAARDKKQAMYGMTAVNQYAFDGGEYVVTEEDRKALGQVTREPVEETGFSDDLRDDEPASVTMTSEEVFDRLGKPDQSGFSVELRETLKRIVRAAYGANGSMKYNGTLATPESATDTLLNNLQGGDLRFAKSLHNLLPMSDQEAYVLASVEETVRSLVNNVPNMRRELSRILQDAKKSVRPEDLYPGKWSEATEAEQTQAREAHAEIFKTEGLTPEDQLARFTGAALGYAPLAYALKNKRSPVKDPAWSGNTFWARLAHAFQHYLDAFQRRLVGHRSDHSLQRQAALLAQRIATVEGRKKGLVYRHMDLLEDHLEKLQRGAGTATSKAATTLANSPFMKDSRFNAVKAMASALEAAADGREDSIVEDAFSLRDRLTESRHGTIAKLISEMRGPLESFQTMFRMVKKHEKDRQALNEAVDTSVTDAFAEEPTKDEWVALTDVLLRTDIAALFQGNLMGELETLLTQPKLLKKTIKQLEQQLPGSHAGAWIVGAKSLGLFLATGRNAAEIARFNAHMIARLSGTTEQVTDAEIKAAEPIIDQLATLYALQHTDTESKGRAAEVIRRENQRTDGGNGVTHLLGLHREVLNDAKQTLFSNDPALMQKGYIRETHNHHIDLQVVAEADFNAYKAAGYDPVGVLPKDPADSNGRTQYLMKTRDGGSKGRITGAVSFTGRRKKGSAITSNGAFLVPPGQARYNQRQVNQVTQAKLQAAKRQHKLSLQDAQQWDPAAHIEKSMKGSNLAPVFSPDGHIVNWRYLMTHATRAHLEPEQRANKVLAATFSSTFDKAGSKVNNERVVKALREQYEEEAGLRPEAYIEVSPDSPENDIAQAYLLLPEEMKRHIREVWGSDRMLVRKDHYDMLFGYQRYSLSDSLTNRLEGKVGDKTHEQVINGLVTDVMSFITTGKTLRNLTDDDELRGQLLKAGRRIRKGEEVLQAFVSEVKDIFVVKNLVTLTGNIVSNGTLLLWAGVPPHKIISGHIEALSGILAYDRAQKELNKLRFQLKSGQMPLGKKKTEARIAELTQELATNSVKELVDAGMFQTIVEDIDTVADPHSYKSWLTNKVEEKTGWLPDPVKTGAKWVYMAHDTPLYKVLNSATHYSDFMARYTLHQHNTSKRIDPMSKEKSLQFISDAFVNYDLPTSRELQYLNDMGIWFFTKYYLRIQKVLWHLFKERPAGLLGVAAMEGMFSSVSSILDSVMWAKLDSNPLSMGALEFPGALDELATIQGMTNLVD